MVPSLRSLTSVFDLCVPTLLMFDGRLNHYRKTTMHWCVHMLTHVLSWRICRIVVYVRHSNYALDGETLMHLSACSDIFRHWWALVCVLHTIWVSVPPNMGNERACSSLHGQSYLPGISLSRSCNGEQAMRTIVADSNTLSLHASCDSPLSLLFHL